MTRNSWLRSLPLLLPRVGRLPVLGIAGLLAVGSMAACGETEPAASAEAGPAEHRIDVAALEVGVSDLESSLQISGNFMPQTRVEIRAKLPGTLSSAATSMRCSAGPASAEAAGSVSLQAAIDPTASNPAMPSTGRRPTRGSKRGSERSQELRVMSHL